MYKQNNDITINKLCISAKQHYQYKPNKKMIKKQENYNVKYIIQQNETDYQCNPLA